MNAVLQEMMRSGAASVGFSGITKIGNVFSRENLINAMLPRAIAGGLNSILDELQSSNHISPSKNVDTNVKPESLDDIENSEEYDLLSVMEEGFDETNENLEKILSVLGDDSNVSIIDSVENQGIQLLTYQREETIEEARLVEVNGKILERLENIENNTKVDELALREKELEARTATSQFSTIIDQNHKSEKERSTIVESALNGMGDLVGSFIGAKAGGKSLKKASGLNSVKPVSTSLSTVPLNALNNKVDTKTNNLTKISNSVKNTTSTISDKIKGAVKGVKNVGGKLLGAPLAVGMGAYETFQTVTDENLSAEEKTVEVSKIGGKTAGAVAGAKAGAVLGSVIGPAGTVLGGLLGGIGGFFLGEKGGEIVGDLINSFTNDSGDIEVQEIKSVKNVNTSNDFMTATNVADRILPNTVLEAGQTRTNNLQMLTQQIETVNHERETMRSSPIIAPITVNNNSTNHSNSSGNIQNSRMNIPSVRNQDGTIQRLLDSNYRPLLS